MLVIDKKPEVGIIIARFQCPILHEGHIEVIETVRANHPRVLVFLGLSPLKCTKNNPFDFAIRRAMLAEKYSDLEVLYIEDVGDNELWSKNLDRMIAKSVGPSLKVVLYGSRDSFVKSYKGHYPTAELVPTKIISASEIRRRIGIKSKFSQDFREGIVYATENQFTSFKATVDMAVIDSKNKKILLARKPGRFLLCFPGGFTDPKKDKSAEDTCFREVQEETGLVMTDKPKYIGSTIIDDWRYRHEEDKIMTFFYHLEYESGTPKASDDIEFVIWKKFGEITDADIANSHRPLIHMLNSYLNNELLRIP